MLLSLILREHKDERAVKVAQVDFAVGVGNAICAGINSRWGEREREKGRGTRTKRKLHPFHSFTVSFPLLHDWLYLRNLFSPSHFASFTPSFSSLRLSRCFSLVPLERNLSVVSRARLPSDVLNVTSLTGRFFCIRRSFHGEANLYSRPCWILILCRNSPGQLFLTTEFCPCNDFQETCLWIKKKNREFKQKYWKKNSHGKNVWIKTWRKVLSTPWPDKQNPMSKQVIG